MIITAICAIGVWLPHPGCQSRMAHKPFLYMKNLPGGLVGIRDPNIARQQPTTFLFVICNGDLSKTAGVEPHLLMNLIPRQLLKADPYTQNPKSRTPSNPKSLSLKHNPKTAAHILLKCHHELRPRFSDEEMVQRSLILENLPPDGKRSTVGSSSNV